MSPFSFWLNMQLTARIIFYVLQAKKFVESVPQTLKENLPKEEAEKLKKTFEALGATVTLS